jgi:hypothetical protein
VCLGPHFHAGTFENGRRAMFLDHTMRLHLEIVSVLTHKGYRVLSSPLGNSQANAQVTSQGFTSKSISSRGFDRRSPDILEQRSE